MRRRVVVVGGAEVLLALGVEALDACVGLGSLGLVDPAGRYPFR